MNDGERGGTFWDKQNLPREKFSVSLILRELDSPIFYFPTKIQTPFAEANVRIKDSMPGPPI